MATRIFVLLFVGTLASFFFFYKGNVSSGKTATEVFKKPGLDEKVPNIKMNNPEGQELDLYQVMKEHKLILIDFWASWCGPCRQENPNVVKVYNEFKDKGFTVFSVSLDENASAWTKAIEKDGLAWQYHVSDLKGWYNSAGVEYGVEGIPTSYLINSKGEVLAVDLRGSQLKKAVQKFIEE